ncbi:MAG: BON domain-containing protein [Betaproteobacteria bacterium]
MRTDRQLQEEVLQALEWEPGVDAADVGVSVDDGVVTLRGEVGTLREKWLAERTTRHVFGVRAVANDLTVAPDEKTARADPAIAQAVANALEWDSAIPDGSVKATVRNGWVTLNGTVAWQYQKAAADRAVQHLYGVKGVNNSIVVKPHVAPGDVRAKIENAFKRSAEVDAERVKVETHDGTVVLRGTVHSLIERDEAERAAWAAPGVTRVEDHLVVVP